MQQPKQDSQESGSNEAYAGALLILGAFGGLATLLVKSPAIGALSAVFFVIGTVMTLKSLGAVLEQEMNKK